jgi:hypothetical protein
MKLTTLRFPIHLLVWVSLTALNLPVLEGESRCPGNIASVTPRFVQRALIVIPVRINQAGPFDFMVDTGSQVTVIDPALSSELNLKSQGSVGLVTVASYAQATVTSLDTLETGSHVVERTPAVVQEIGQIQAVDPRIRGVLGESFLAHFDLLVDYGHKLLCLDETRAMRNSIHGEHIQLVSPQHPEDELPFMERLVISVHLSGAGTKQILLQLDSGSDGPVLYARTDRNALSLLDQAAPRKGSLTAAQKAFDALPPQELQVGKLTMSHVPFVTPVSAGKYVPMREEDGLLPTLLFHRIFISGAERYVVFEPR